jgi:hypothetical protein
MVRRLTSSGRHCSLVFAPRDNALESFHRYRATGVNVDLGTDTYPRDLISEMRWPSLVCKVVERDFFDSACPRSRKRATDGLGCPRAAGRAPQPPGSAQHANALRLDAERQVDLRPEVTLDSNPQELGRPPQHVAAKRGRRHNLRATTASVAVHPRET